VVNEVEWLNVEGSGPEAPTVNAGGIIAVASRFAPKSISDVICGEMSARLTTIGPSAPVITPDESG